MAIFDHAHPKIVESTLAFLNSYQHNYSICSFFRLVTRLTTPIFDHAQPKKKFDQLLIHVSTCKKSVYIFHLFILRYSQFWSPITRLATPIFGHVHPQNFQSSFNLCEIVAACKKLVQSVLAFRF